MTLRRMGIEYLGEIPLECDSFNEILKWKEKGVNVPIFILFMGLVGYVTFI